MELSAICGKSISWLSAVERGENGLDAIDLERIAQATGFALDYFLRRDYVARMPRPRTRQDYEVLYAGDPSLAQAHFDLDRAITRARGPETNLQEGNETKS